MPHSPEECRVCAVVEYSKRRARGYVSVFLKSRDEWLDAEVKKFRQRGISAFRLTTWTDGIGTLWLLVDDQKVSGYGVDF